MDQRIIDLYDDFTHRHLDRRLFIEQVTKLVGSSALAMTMMAALRSDYARAATIPADDARLTTQNVSMPGGVMVALTVGCPVKFSDFTRTTIERAGLVPNLANYRLVLEEAFSRTGKKIRLIGIGVRFAEIEQEMAQLPLL